MGACGLPWNQLPRQPFQNADIFCSSLRKLQRSTWRKPLAGSSCPCSYSPWERRGSRGASGKGPHTCLADGLERMWVLSSRR